MGEIKTEVWFWDRGHAEERWEARLTWGQNFYRGYGSTARLAVDSAWIMLEEAAERGEAG